MGNFIQIMNNENIEFLNTITGEIGTLGISAQLNETHKIDLNNASNILSIIDVTPLELPSAENSQNPKLKNSSN